MPTTELVKQPIKSVVGKKSWQPLNITQPVVLPLTKFFILLVEFIPWLQFWKKKYKQENIRIPVKIQFLQLSFSAIFSYTSGSIVSSFYILPSLKNQSHSVPDFQKNLVHIWMYLSKSKLLLTPELLRAKYSKCLFWSDWLNGYKFTVC